MLKNKFKIIILLFVFILAFTFTISRAADTIDPSYLRTDEGIDDTEEDGNGIMLINEGQDEPVTTSEEATDTPTEDEAEVDESATDSTQDYEKKDLYIMQDDVTIDNIVDGNVFIIANNVTINSQIGGDVFICATNINIGTEGYIYSNLFATAEKIDIQGIVCDLYSVSSSINIDGYILRDIHVSSQNVNILGTVERNAFISCSKLNMVSESYSTENSEDTESKEFEYGTIGGSLNYTADEDANVPRDAVEQDINFSKTNNITKDKVAEYILAIGTFVATVLVIWLVCSWLAPNFLKNTASYITTKKVLPAIGFGILTPIVAIIASIILLIIGLTSTLGLLLLLILFLLLAISTSIFVIAVNSVICNKLKIEKRVITLGILIISSIVLWLVGLIPYVGSIVNMIAVVIGLGIIVSSILSRKKAEKVESTQAE